MFQKTNSKELEKTIAVVECLLLIGMPIVYLLQYFKIIELDHMSLGEFYLVFFSMILLMFDIMYICLKENRFISMVGVLCILFSISIIMSTLFAQFPRKAFAGNEYTNEGCMVMISYMIIFFSGSLIREKSNRRMIIVTLIVVGIMQAVFAIMQAVLKLDFCNQNDMFVDFNMDGRASGMVYNPNPYGSVMVLMTGIVYGLYYNASSVKKKVIFGLLSVLFTYGVIISGTRGAWLGLAVTALIFSIVACVIETKNGKKVIDTIKKLAVVVCFVAVAFGITFIASNDTVQDVVNRNEADASANQLGEDRLMIWSKAIDDYVKQFPIIGVGVANVNSLLKMQIQMDEEKTDWQFAMFNDCHNRYLNVWCSQGIIGFVIYMAIIIYIIVSIIRAIKQSGLDDGYYTFGLSIATVGYMVADFFCIGQVYMVPYFFAIVGLLVTRKKLFK